MNTSCSCHPEYDTREHETLHSIPADQLIIDLDEQIAADDYYVGCWGIKSEIPYLTALTEKVAAEKQAKKDREAREAQERIDIQKRAAEKRERDELARLSAKYQ